MKTKILAVLAVLAMAFAGVAVITEAQQNDAAGITGDYQPVAYAKDTTAAAATDYLGLRAILYEDKVLMLDTTDVKLKDSSTKYYDGASLFTVTMVPEDGAPATAAVVDQVPSQNGRIYLDLDGIKDNSATPIALLTEGTLTVTLKAYGNTAELGTVAIAVPDTLSQENGITLKTNHTDGWTDANKPETAITYVNPLLYAGSRNVDYVMDDTAKNASNVTIFKDPNGLYNLKGWGLNFEGDVVIYPDANLTVEEIIYKVADYRAAKSLAAIDFTETITLYAMYDKTSYALTVQDQANADDTKWTFVSSDATLRLGAVKTGDVVASASITSNVTSDSFALLKIAQNTTLGQYVYKFDGTDGKVEKYDRTNQTWGPAALNTDYKVKTIANGIYQITEVKSDLRFTVKAVSTDAASTTAYNFAIDDIKNPVTSGHANGTVELSLDLYDYTIDSAQHYITLDGTYYRSVGDNVRIYGNIDSLDSTKKTWASYIDLYDADDTDGVLSLTTTNSVYDLSLTLADDYSIYAAQGLWHQKDAVADPAADAVELTTPWSLYKA